MARDGDNLVIQMGGEDSGSVTTMDWYKESNAGLSGISFADGTNWNRDDIDAIAAGMREPFSAAETDWGSDLSLAEIDFAAERIRMDIAVALLGFEGPDKGQVADFTWRTAENSRPIRLSASNSFGPADFDGGRSS
jgi:hypothetical protein